MKTITLELKPDDAEPILRQAAFEAAKYSALCDYVTKRTYNSPWRSGQTFEETRKRWDELFRKAKRMVEAFGVEYQQTSEEETLTVAFDTAGGTTKVVDLGGAVGKVGWRSGGELDFKHPKPSYRGGVHEEACRQAAERTVRTWRAGLSCGAVAA